MKRPRGKGMPCLATTKHGTRCPNKAPREMGLCHIHQERNEPHCNRVNYKTKNQCKNPAGESGYCKQHTFTRRVSK